MHAPLPLVLITEKSFFRLTDELPENYALVQMVDAQDEVNGLVYVYAYVEASGGSVVNPTFITMREKLALHATFTMAEFQQRAGVNYSGWEIRFHGPKFVHRADVGNFRIMCPKN